MKQLALDIGVGRGPTLANFLAGPNEAAVQHLRLWIGEQGVAALRSPVPTYLWGPAASGKTHLLHVWAQRAGATLLAGPSLPGTAPPPAGPRR